MKRLRGKTRARKMGMRRRRKREKARTAMMLRWPQEAPCSVAACLRQPLPGQPS
jgi:hypothetical protein